MKHYKLLGSVLVMILFCVSSVSQAASDETESNTACPVGLVKGLTLADEFGQAVADNTRCIQKRHDVKTMFGVNEFHASGSSTQPYALNQINNVLNDYEITDGMKEGVDFQIIAVVHGGGGFLLLSDPTVNPYIDQVKDLMARGVTFYFCENTVRGFIRAGYLQQGNVAEGVIPGVKYVTAGLAAMSDFEALGWSYVQP